MQEYTSYRHCLRLAGIAMAGVFGLLVGIAILCAIYPASGLNHFFTSVCHQQPHRSHWWDGSPLGVCIRCFWLYTGLLIGHARFAFFQYIPKSRVLLLMISGILVALDWISGWWMSDGNAVWIRIFSSTLIGIAISHFTTPPLATWIYQRNPSILKQEINHEYK